MTSDLIQDTERLFRCIGEIVVRFQKIENDIAEVLSSMLKMKDPSDTHRVTAAMSYKQKLNLMCDLYEERKNPAWPPIDIVLVRSALESAETFRNSIVHSLWSVGENPSKWIRTKANLRSKGKLKIVTGPANIEALEEAITCLKTIRDWYLGFSEQLQEATKLLNKISRQLSERQSQTLDQALPDH